MANIKNEFSKVALKEIIGNTFPRVKFAIAYGSAVFPQANIKVRQPSMVDLWLVVNNRQQFHLDNMEMNREHYSGLSRWFGASYIQFINKWIFPIHFNSHIQLESQHVKYGVVDYDTFTNDLNRWGWLTIAGRMHKPVRFITFWQRINMEMIEQNLMRCMCCALLLINKPVFLEKDLYIKVTELSYRGDIRFWVRMESPNKVKNIVEGNFVNFQKIYRAVVDKYFDRYVTYDDGNIYVDLSKQFRSKLVTDIPQNIKLHMIKRNQTLQSFVASAMLKIPLQLSSELDQAIRKTNWRSSLRMAMYHALSSSWLKNFVYSTQKRLKAKK